MPLFSVAMNFCHSHKRSLFQMKDWGRLRGCLPKTPRMTTVKSCRRPEACISIRSSFSLSSKSSFGIVKGFTSHEPTEMGSMHHDCQTETSSVPLDVRCASSGKLTNDPFSTRWLQSLNLSPSKLIRSAASTIVRPLP